MIIILDYIGFLSGWIYSLTGMILIVINVSGGVLINIVAVIGVTMLFKKKSPSPKEIEQQNAKAALDTAVNNYISIKTDDIWKPAILDAIRKALPNEALPILSLWRKYPRSSTYVLEAPGYRQINIEIKSGVPVFYAAPRKHADENYHYTECTDILEAFIVSKIYGWDKW